MAKAAYDSICGERREACRYWRHLLRAWVCHLEQWLCARVTLAAPSWSGADSQGFLFGLTHLHPVFQELLRRSLPLARPLHPLSDAGSVLQPLPTPGTFLKAWIVLPCSCFHVDVVYPRHGGLRAQETCFGSL